MIANADAARIPLPDKSVHCVVTSPPYFGPRKYKGEQARDWPAVSYSPMPGLPPLEVPAMRCELGREKTPEAYVAHLVLCFREVYRVLRDDGTCWVVEGDSYASGEVGRHDAKIKRSYGKEDGGIRLTERKNTSLAQGNLLAIPYRLLLALQADGWLVRNDVVWSKVAPMPESVSGTHWERHQVKVRKGSEAGRKFDRQGLAENGYQADVGNAPNAEWSDCPGCPHCSATGSYVLRRGSWRHTRSHESILMLTKNMGYFADQERVREKFIDERMGNPGTYHWGYSSGSGRQDSSIEKLALQGWNAEGDKTGRNPRDVLKVHEQLMALRQDLTEEERNYVIKRLAENGLL